MTDRIPQEELDAARRRLGRHIAAVIIQCMADNDVSFALMAVRIGRTEKVIRGWIEALMDGATDGEGTKLDQISDMFWSMGAVPKITLIPRNA